MKRRRRRKARKPKKRESSLQDDLSAGVYIHLMQKSRCTQKDKKTTLETFVDFDINFTSTACKTERRRSERDRKKGREREISFL